jgi:hypothetical protein
MAGTAIPVCAEGDGGVSMGYDDKRDFVETRQFRILFWGGVALAIAGTLFYIGKNEPEYVRQITAEPYVWPEGCEVKEYEILESVSPKCFQDKYYLGSGAEYGWHRSKYGGTRYYRVGNDAIAVGSSCINSKNIRCEQIGYVGNVFVVSGEIK